MAEDNSLIIKIVGKADDFVNELDKVQKKTRSLGNVLKTVAKGSTVAFAAFAGSIALATNEFIKYEKALVGVGKTTNIEGAKLDKFGKQFQKLSETIPISTNELLGIAQAAGQLGVKGEKNLLKFTETVAKLGVATDLSGEQAATTLTRILNTTGEGIESIDTFGSVIVALGNNFAASESEIARMTNEVARSTSVFNVSAAEAAAFGTAMRSVGIQAQLGGSVVGKSFREIDAAVRTGGKSLDAFAKITGLTGAELKQTFEEDSTKAFQLFIEGLGRISEEGGSVSLALEEVGLKGDEVNKVLPVLAKNSDLVASALAVANKEVENATALNDEAEKAFATLGAEKEKLTNTVINLATELGTELAPTIKELLISTRQFLVAVRNTDTSLFKSLATFLKWGAIISGIVAGISTFLVAALSLSAGIGALSAAFLPAAVAASAFWVAVTGPIGIAVAGLALVTAGIVTLFKAANSQKPDTIDQINDKVKDLDKSLNNLNSRGASRGRDESIKQIKKEIEELKKLRAEKIAATKDFGTGSLLIRAEADPGPDLGLGAFGIDVPTANIPLAAEGSEDVVEKEKKKQENITAVVDDATKKRIEKLRAANEEQALINKARSSVTTDEEKALAGRLAEIENERLAAKKITNKEEQKLALENITLQHSEELAEIAKQQATIAENRAASLEEQAELKRIFEEEEIANRELLTEEELVALEEKLLSEDEVKQAYALQEAERGVRDRNKFLEDSLIHGEAIAKANQFFRQKEILGAKQGASQLIALTNSKNSTLKSIGKAAASTQAAIATGEGAIKAYSSLAGIPIVGPFLGAAAAAAVVAYGIEQQSTILGANTGGLVPLGSGSVGRDSVPAMLTPNEIVAPDKSFDEVVEGTAVARGFTPPEDDDSRFGGGSGGVQKIIVELQPADDFIGMIEQKQIEVDVQNTGVA